MGILQGDQAHELCEKLLHAETEAEVIDGLKAHKLWDDRLAWVPYGGVANNLGVVGNQQSSPVAALVEKLVNSIDAVLTAECYLKGLDPRGQDAPQTMQAAVEEFLMVPGGRIQNLSAKPERRLPNESSWWHAGRRRSLHTLSSMMAKVSVPRRFQIHSFLF